MAPICTDFLLVQLRLLNETEALQNAVSFPGEIDLKMQHIGREELGSWGDNFCRTAVVLGNVVPVDTINLSYDTLSPDSPSGWTPRPRPTFVAETCLPITRR
ncbi:hypothetical protein [Burkholderia glumae]|uniref:Uncharacterized protein n=1 Tax=Burkholderia glumae TaxID=337 RepID=A0ABY5BFG5_BURGL|nr:hypothetical protein [Burkholderia glumae]AJY67286.1 hypothetical protein KS03_561 [Burkholderia glumae LMG 2196 = ATCC 33617]MCM2482187.1 hypothetical protein [Burkholderia glumae]MCM2507670.1 hypothetical protein [Burkholderia glumae]MCM2536342.1 hypothetical protein [Burkholderia glumae]QKM52548.1 hypothetical protein CG017_00539 [Burkholderia glumae]